MDGRCTIDGTILQLIFQNEELNEVHILGKAVAFQSDVK